MFPLSERLLRLVWEQRLFRSDALRTADGRTLTILHPGRFNDDEGPDYTAARVRIGSVTYEGDVELHLTASAWSAHGHTADPHYNRVILHVVLDDDGLRAPASTASRRLLPLLVLRPYLDPAFRPVLDDDRGAPPRRADRLPCPGRRVGAATARLRLEALAGERIELKVRRFDERLRELVLEQRSVVREPYPRYYGNPDEIPPPHRAYTRRDVTNRSIWEQLLYEGVMEALGYAKNTSPFAQLARSVPLALLRSVGLEDREATMALLFGAAGLLPSTRRVEEKDSRRLLRTLRRRWPSLRPMVKGPLVHEGDWRFFRLRPANFPTARLAAFHAALPQFPGTEGFRTIVGLLKDETLHPRTVVRRLAGMLEADPGEYWRRHYRFGEAAPWGGATLGRARVHEVLVNAILPVILLYARVFNDPLVRTRAMDVLRAVPQGHPLPERITVARTFGEAAVRGGALRSQGALHLVRLYCASLRCAGCGMLAHP
jgi:hypothetical protein